MQNKIGVIFNKKSGLQRKAQLPEPFKSATSKVSKSLFY
jgi:hypothetical protein